MRLGRFVFISAALLLGTVSARAQTLAIGASKDNTLFYAADSNAQLSNGTGQFIFAGRTMQDSGTTGTISLRRGLIAFDTSAIPTYATINAATLTMNSDRSPDTNTFTISVHKLLADWGEGTSDSGGSGSGGGGGAGAPATQNDATWLYRFYNTTSPTSSPAWSNPGAEGDYVTTASATVSITGSMAPVPYSWFGAGVTADVQSWVLNPSGNFGWLVKGIEDQGPGTVRRFEGRSNTLTNNHPVLLIDYSVPEPASAFALVMGGVMVQFRLRRKR